jgi:hypothetical protein
MLEQASGTLVKWLWYGEPRVLQGYSLERVDISSNLQRRWSRRARSDKGRPHLDPRPLLRCSWESTYAYPVAATDNPLIFCSTSQPFSRRVTASRASTFITEPSLITGLYNDSVNIYNDHTGVTLKTVEVSKVPVPPQELVRCGLRRFPA